MPKRLSPNWPAFNNRTTPLTDRIKSDIGGSESHSHPTNVVVLSMIAIVRRKIKNAMRDVRNGSMLWQKIKHLFRVRAWTAVALQIILILLLGSYTSSHSKAFLSTFNLQSLLLATLPLALATMAQVN